MSVRFSLRAPNGQETVITGPFRIGRDPECQIQVDNNLVSRIHASIWVDHDHLLLRDERSRNGTQLNGRPLAPGENHYLHHGDAVTIGDTTFVVQSGQPAAHPGGLPALAEAEPPPTTPVIGPSPARTPGAPDLARAQPRRLPVWALVLGGCLAVLLLALCCALGFYGASAGGPMILTALAAPAQSTAIPGSAPAADGPWPLAQAAPTAAPPPISTSPAWHGGHAPGRTGEDPPPKPRPIK